jgi:transposase
VPQERGQPMESYYIGMDIHHKKTMYVVMDEAGKIVDRGSINTTQEEYAGLFFKGKIPAGTKVALESGDKMYWASKILVEAGMQPVVISAQEVRARARRPNQKSDHRDAFEICDGLRRNIYTSIVYVPPPEVQKLRQILSRRRHFVEECTRQINAAKFLVRGVGDIHRRLGLITVSGWERLLKEEKVASIRKYLTMHYRIWKQAKEILVVLDKELMDACKPFKELLELLQTMPGVGSITSAAFVAAIGDISRFRTAAEVASYIGVVPSTYDSGGKERHGHITKSGPSYVRSLLCEAAHHAARADHPMHPSWKKHMVKSGYKKAVTAIGHRIVRILFSMWKNGQAFDPAKLLPAGAPATRVYKLKRVA